MDKFTSIFHKLLAYYISVTLLGFGFLALLINFSLQEFLIKNKEASLFKQADEIVNSIQEVNNPSTDQAIESAISYYKRTSNTKMDFIILNEKLGSRKATKFNKKLLNKTELQDQKLLEKVLMGDRVKEVGTLRKANDEKLVIVGIPIREDGLIMGALFLHTPIQELQTGQITKIIIIVSILIAIPSIIVLYWVSRKISNPLVEMNHAAKRMGKGHFRQRIEVESRDEVGHLAIAFNQMGEQLESLETMRKELIINVSHELRTPITSVRGYIQGMAEGVIPMDQHRKYLDICYREITRLSNLLNTMLDLSAIETGRITLHPISVSWASVLDSVIENIIVRAEKKQIMLSIIHEDSESDKVFGDPERLKQIVFNLLDNAIRHTPEGGSIVIRSKNIGQVLEIQISDTGSGINPDDLPFIWERFYTGDSSRKSHREQSGLGLTITKQLIELMGGSVTVYSIMDEGTTFTLRLPSHH